MGKKVKKNRTPGKRIVEWALKGLDSTEEERNKQWASENVEFQGVKKWDKNARGPDEVDC